MSILDFVSQETLDNLDEDPNQAFMEIVNSAQRSLSAKLDRLDPNQNEDYLKIDNAQYSFLNVIVAAAKRLEVEPFLSMTVPTYDNFKDVDHRQFKADLDHYVTQLVLDNSLRARRDSVAILPASKDRLRAYTNSLKECVETAKMSEAKRKALLSKLAEFEAELDKQRVSMISVAKLVYLVLGVPGTLWASADIVHKLTTNVMHVVAEAKADEDSTKQITSAAPIKSLEAPRPALPPKPKPFYADDLDDNVPF